MEKNTVYRLILAVAVAAAVFTIGYHMRPDLFGREDTSQFGIIDIRSGGTESLPRIGGQIVYVEGGVEYRSGPGLWTRAAEGMDLEEGDAVETLGGGRAIIALDDGSVLRLDAHTQIALDSTEPHAMVVKLIGGKIYSRVVAADRTFEVVAGDTIYESLGTAYTTEYEDGQEGVKVFHSRVKVKDSEGNDLAIVDEGKKYYVKGGIDPDAEGKVVDLRDEEVKEDGFARWNAGEDSKYFKAEMGVMASAGGTESGAREKKASGATESLSLSYDRNGKVFWSLIGATPEGFKLVWSKDAGPTYPTRSGDKFRYYDDPDARIGTIYAFDGAGTYHIRVCEYLGGACGVYSNEVTATFVEDAVGGASKKTGSESSSVTSIALSCSGTKARWSVNGRSSAGFKLVWSKNADPTYPTRSGDRYEYYSDPETRAGGIHAFDGAGTYHVRVCEYLGGKCGVYSNEIIVSLE